MVWVGFYRRGNEFGKLWGWSFVYINGNVEFEG